MKNVLPVAFVVIFVGFMRSWVVFVVLELRRLRRKRSRHVGVARAFYVWSWVVL